MSDFRMMIERQEEGASEEIVMSPGEASPLQTSQGNSNDDEYAPGDEIICKKDGVWYPAVVVSRSYRMRKEQRIAMYKLQLEGWHHRLETTEGGRRLLPRTPENMAMSAKSVAEAARHEAPGWQSPSSQKTQKKVAAGSPSIFFQAEEQQPQQQQVRLSHPTYAEMTSRALSDLTKKGVKSGVSAIAVGKWITSNYNVHPTNYKASVASALKQGVKQGRFLKIKASFRLTPKEMRARQKSKGKQVQESERAPPKPRLADDLDIKQRTKDKNLPMPQFVLSQSPAECAQAVLAVAEFCHEFEDVLFHNYIPPSATESRDTEHNFSANSGTKRKRSTLPPKKKVLLGVAELDCALSLLPISQSHSEIRVPPLLERLVLALLRHICGRFAKGGELVPDPNEQPNRLEEVLYVGHRQNRWLWGQALNAATWPDILRRHLAAERRYRQRLADAYPPLTELHAFTPQNDQAEQNQVVTKVSPQDILEDALTEFCDQKKSFALLSPVHCAAILQSLVDDALSTGPALHDAVNAYEAKLHEHSRRLRAADVLKKKIQKYINSDDNEIPKHFADDKVLKTISNKMEALDVLETVTAEFRTAKTERTEDCRLNNCLRRNAIGADRFYSRYWAGIQSLPVPKLSTELDAMTKKPKVGEDTLRPVLPVIKNHVDLTAVPNSSDRLVVRLTENDERYNYVLSPWCAVDLGSRDPLFRHALDVRGQREHALVSALADAEKERGQNITTISSKTSASKRRELEEAILLVGDALSEAVRSRLQAVRERPPARTSSAGMMPWPAPLDREFEFEMNEQQVEMNNEEEQNDDENDPFDEDEMEIDDTPPVPIQPRRSTRIVIRESEQMNNKQPASMATKKIPKPKSDSAKEKEDEQALIERAAKAGDDMAPWRQRFPTLAHALLEFRTQLNEFDHRLNTITDPKTKKKQSNEMILQDDGFNIHKAIDLYQDTSVKERFLEALCHDARRLERKLFGLSMPEDKILFEQSSEKEEDDTPQKADEETSDFVEKDAILEDDYFALIGPCSDIPRYRELWHQAIDACILNTETTHEKHVAPDTTFEARASAFATLYGSLAETAGRQAVFIEAWSKSAARILENDARLTATIFIPSDPKPGFIWARIRGFPWWPAREYEPKSQHFARALQNRNHTLLVFINEASMYLIDKASVEPFTGLPDDPRMPKSNKSCAKGLLSALEIVKAVLQKESAALIEDEDLGQSALLNSAPSDKNNTSLQTNINAMDQHINKGDEQAIAPMAIDDDNTFS